MTTVRLRPTFSVRLQAPRESATETIGSRFDADERFAGRWQAKGRWGELSISEEDRRVWSPQLSIRLDEEEEGSTLFARFAPHPEIWTFFMFLYFAIAFFVVLGGTFGYVQWASNESAWGLWSLWIGIPALGLIHLAGAVGQRLGHDQMLALKAELEEVIEGLVSTSAPNG